MVVARAVGHWAIGTAQHQGLWARWTVVVGDVLGVLRLPLPWLHRVVMVVGSPSREIDSRALAHDAWALQPSGWWLRGVALAPPDCSGGCVLWWAFMVAAHAVGHWVIDTARLCAAPGPLGLVYDGCGGAGGALPLVDVVVAARRRDRWLVTACVWLAIAVACLCTVPGPLGPVDGGMGGCPWCHPIANAVIVAHGCGLWQPML